MQRPEWATRRSNDRRRVVARARGRGGWMIAAIWCPFVVVSVLTLNSLVGYTSPAVAVVALLLAAAWMVWLRRPSVLVTDTTVVRRGLVSSVELPIDRVECFEVTTMRMPLEWMSRTVELVIRRSDGSVVMCPWIGWVDMITPLMTAGTRPVTASQQRVLDRLNAALDEGHLGAATSPGTALPRN